MGIVVVNFTCSLLNYVAISNNQAVTILNIFDLLSERKDQEEGIQLFPKDLKNTRVIWTQPPPTVSTGRKSFILTLLKISFAGAQWRDCDWQRFAGHIKCLIILKEAA